MKKFILFSFVLVSFQASASAMMRCPSYAHELREGKECNGPLRARLKRMKAAVNSPKNTEILDISAIVSQAALEVYHKINKNWTYLGRDGVLKVESPYWTAGWQHVTTTIGAQEQQTRCATLMLKCDPRDVTATLEDLINKPAEVECTVALTTAKIFILKKLLGEDKFKNYAVDFYNELIVREGWSTNDFFHELPLQFMKKIEGKEQPGSIAYITNLSDYTLFKPTGHFAGENLVCVGDNQYIGFGDMYKEGQQSLEEIEAEGFRQFCRLDDVERPHQDHQLLSQWFGENPEEFKKWRREEQEANYNFHFVFDAEAIKAYKKTKWINL